MDDEVQVGWKIDPDVRAALRLDRARTAIEQGEFDAAVMELEELLDEDPQHAEALFLLGEAALEIGDVQTATLAFQSHLQVEEKPTAAAWSGLALARFDTCDVEGAAAAAREALVLEPDHAEAWFTLGCALERTPGQGTEALRALATAQRLDPESFPFPLRVAESDWQGLVRKAATLLPRALREFWSEVPVSLQDWPDLAELAASEPPITPTVTGLYKGTPPGEEDAWDVRPEALRLYTKNLERSPSREAVVEAIARTLDHEAREWLGLGPDDPV